MSKSNLDVLMSTFSITPQQLSIAISADITLISRWRTGKRRLVPGRHWIEAIAAYFVEIDTSEGKERLRAILAIFYPADNMATPEGLRTTLEKWLAVRGQADGDYAERRDRQLRQLLAVGDDGQPLRRLLEAGAPYITHGQQSTRVAILDMLDKARGLPEPPGIRFVCPEGLALLTQDASFGRNLMNRLEPLFAAGSRLHVALTVDYKMSEVSAFSGRWLSSHLKGYIRSYYNDDFFSPHNMHMMAVFGDKLCFRVLEDSANGVRGEFYFNTPQIAEFSRETERYFSVSRMRFHYDFFKSPDGYLVDGPGEITSDCFLMTRLPHLGVRGRDLLHRLNLTDEEIAYFEDEYSILLTCPENLEPGNRFFHILSSDDIERALDKPRHRVQPPGDIFSRRVYMTIQVLVNQLVDI